LEGEKKERRERKVVQGMTRGTGSTVRERREGYGGPSWAAVAWVRAGSWAGEVEIDKGKGEDGFREKRENISVER
jgi:hypothetical protein